MESERRRGVVRDRREEVVERSGVERDEGLVLEVELESGSVSSTGLGEEDRRDGEGQESGVDTLVVAVEDARRQREVWESTVGTYIVNAPPASTAVRLNPKGFV